MLIFLKQISSLILANKHARMAREKWSMLFLHPDQTLIFTLRINNIRVTSYILKQNML
ncbi:Uncharacterised protein [Legionella cincinnatiensis]|uniref:Uncharacterized protein n=1 Tax=Legionella cincinnatiensis TaxID=28085 RepID=A0A378IJ31_9GAMM|nr:hypothetical protein Lcin_2227 [Legionella cincinnatiensis]STX34501.1 Uncharacterised protein [Legionella cincinnatiensis]